jgi:O-antigen/teichoic acid export membrane protein
MSDFRKLARHFSHHLAGRATLMLLGFVSFPIFTRIFSVADYGVMTLVSQTVLVFTVLAKLGLQNSIQRFQPQAEMEGEVQRFHSTMLVGSAVVSAIVSVAFLAGICAIPSSILGVSLKNVLAVASALILVRAGRMMYGNMLQIEGKTISLNVLEILVKAASIAACCALLLYWKATVLAFFAGLALTEAAALLALVPDLWARVGRRALTFDYSHFRSFIRFASPLMWGELAWVILDSGDRFLVRGFLGTQAVGYYSAAYNISAYLQEALMTPLNLAFFPLCMIIWTTQGEEKTREFLSRSLTYFMLGAIGLLAIASVVSRDAVVLLASKKYLEAHRLLPVLIAGLFVSALQVFFKAGLMIRKEPAKLAKVTFFAAAVNILLNILLLPMMGNMGAAVATLVSYALWVFLMARASLAIFPFTIEYHAFARYAAAGTVTAAIIYAVHFDNVVAGLAIRGTIGILCYLFLVALFDSNARFLMFRLIRAKNAPADAVLSG